MNREDYIKKWLDDTLSEEEKKKFDQTGDLRFLQKLDHSLKRFKAPEFNVAEQVEKLDIKERKQETKVIFWSQPWLKVAASILIAVAAVTLYLYNSGSSKPEQVTSLKKSVMYLPDSSEVALNAHSTLRYNGDSWEESRRVELQGEAYFRVRSGSKFDVITSSGTVSVVGTQFNVKNREGYFEVNCFEGKVKVSARGKEVFLDRGESLRALNGKVQSVDIELGDVPDWKRGETKFKSVPFIHVVNELQRQYNIEVKTTNINTQQLFTGAFTHDNINLALKSISLPLNLSYQLEDNQVQILGDQ